MKPRLLDLFCGAGGAAMGYHRAGFEVVGVDINPQPHYPFEFHQADAMTYPLDGFDAIHASPPCQAYTWAARGQDRTAGRIRDDLAGQTRERLLQTKVPYVIENVEAAGPIIGSNLMLCGQMFRLGVIRHRVFAVRPSLGLSPHHPPCTGLVKLGLASSVAGHGGDTVKGRGSLKQKQADMGIDWMNIGELNESIPPAYTEWIGHQLLATVAFSVAKGPY